MCDHVYTEREYVTPLFENPLTVLSICAETFYHEVSLSAEISNALKQI